MVEIKRVCAYCRVSTDKSDQLNSFESQRRFFEEYIGKRHDWVLCGIYCDEGVTGTSTRHRNGFNSMICAAEAGKFDLILTKEISRFARNTLDSIYYTRRLRNMGVGVIFMNDGISTLDADSELRLTIMASVAQEESRRTSERVKWGQRRQMEKGVVFGRAPLGYTLENGILEVDEKRAREIRMIFHMYTEEGIGTYTIARRLNELGIRPPHRAEMWRSAAVARILKNEKYCGDLIQQKTYTPDYLSHEKRINRGEVELVKITAHHQGIVDREVFDRAQELLASRGGRNRVGNGVRFPFSGKVRCSSCGCGYTSKFRKTKNGGYRIWRCSGNCGNSSIRDNDLRAAVEEELRNIDMGALFTEVRRLLGIFGAEVRDEDIIMLMEPQLCDEILGNAIKHITVDRGEVRVQLWEARKADV